MSTTTAVFRALKTGSAAHRRLVAEADRGPAHVLHRHVDVDPVPVADRRQELDLDLHGGEADAFAVQLRIRLPQVARAEVLERHVEEVDEVRVVGDPRRIEVAEANEDGRAEQGATPCCRGAP